LAEQFRRPRRWRTVRRKLQNWRWRGRSRPRISSSGKGTILAQRSSCPTRAKSWTGFFGQRQTR
jgi:hypothetical protein